MPAKLYAYIKPVTALGGRSDTIFKSVEGIASTIAQIWFARFLFSDDKAQGL
jgi:hypothetical protein